MCCNPRVAANQSLVSSPCLNFSAGTMKKVHRWIFHQNAKASRGRLDSWRLQQDSSNKQTTLAEQGNGGTWTRENRITPPFSPSGVEEHLCSSRVFRIQRTIPVLFLFGVTHMSRWIPDTGGVHCLRLRQGWAASDLETTCSVENWKMTFRVSGTIRSWGFPNKGKPI